MDNDLIRRSDALKELCDRSTPAFTTLGKPTFKVDYIDAINDVPAVDAVEVVRCGECKWYDPRTKNCLDGLYGVIETDWFCADGQRRGDGDA